MKFSEIMQYVFGIFKELLSLLRISKENKSKEVDLKNKEEFKEREEKQQEVTLKDKDENLISQVVQSKSEIDRQAKLEEIRRIISK